MSSLTQAQRPPRLPEAIAAAFDWGPAPGGNCARTLEALWQVGEEAAAMAAPQAPGDVRRLLHRVAGTTLLGATIDPAHGGSGLSAVARHLCTEHLSRFSNELAFLSQQHLGATALINAERHELGTAPLLPAYANGGRTIGIAASHLRHGAGGIAATPEGSGLRLRGTAAWVSGYGIFDDVLIAGRGPAGEALLFILPFRDGSGMAVRALPDLWAMEATATVCIEIDTLVEPGRPAATDKGGRFSLSHGGYLFQPACHTLGLLYRILHHFAAAEPAMEEPMVAALARAAARIGAARRRFYELLEAFAPAQPTAAALDEMLWLRASLAQQSTNLAGALCALSGGKSLLSRFRLAPLLEEAVFFSTTTVNGQMKAAMTSCLVEPGMDFVPPVRGIAA